MVGGAMKLAILLALCLALTPGCASSAAAPTVRSQVDRVVADEWVQWLVRRRASPLPALVPPLGGADAFLSSLQGSIRKDRDVGFGARLVRLAVDVGYTTCWVDVLIHKDTVARLEMRFSSPGSPKWPVIEATLLEVWPQLRPAEKGLEYVYGDPVAQRALDAQRARALGKPSGAKVPLGLRAALSTLTDAFGELSVGSVCGYAGREPPGRTAVTALANAGRLDLIGDVLRGPNLEGRVYAALELLMAQATRGWALPPADRAAISAIRKLETPVSVCEGCLFGSRSAVELLGLDSF